MGNFIQTLPRPALRDSTSSLPERSLPGQRIAVDGKFFRRSQHRFRIQGATYGPFAPNASGVPLPDRRRVEHDFEQMNAAGINALRLYHSPPQWFLESAEQFGLALLIDIPWSKHLCFLDTPSAQAEARLAVRQAVKRGLGFASVLAYSVGNEIPPGVVRWHGKQRTERFLRELIDVAKQADPQALATYASYPPTEYLDVSSADFLTFNVYLHDRAAFRRYLHRLQNLVGDKPLVLGELGMDTIRHGELDQAEFLSGHLRETLFAGAAGAFVFSWTDDWHTGGHAVEDWAFGLTDRDRRPKASYHAVRELFESAPAALLPAAPKVSIVVCTYNGGATLRQCLESLLEVKYPSFEIIVVDDGSTDDTVDILLDFPSVIVIRQPNRGLSAARNAGLYAATGEIIAYTDSDCFADADWLTLLVEQLERSGAAAVGGPNLTPDDGWLASCVGASPGQPTHVLENDQVAEHIPGCNMAFRREVLMALSGFDPQYRTAGDDVDICWRLQQAGDWITFAPGAFVWHHRRQTPRTYFRQQAGYGEAEALLRFHHPARFNGLGSGKWNGVVYGDALQGIRLAQPLIHRGAFGMGMFQCLYQPQVSHWAMLPSTLEWHALILVCLLLGLLLPQAALLGAVMLLASGAVAAAQAYQAKLPRKYDGVLARLVVMFLCYVQPLVRAWRRQRTRFFSHRRSVLRAPAGWSSGGSMPWLGSRVIDYWSDNGTERLQLIQRILTAIGQQRWTKTLDNGWESWDLELFCNSWTVAQMVTADEEHGSGKRLIRVRYLARPSDYAVALFSLATVVLLCAALLASWSAAAVAAPLFGIVSLGYWSGKRRCSALIALVNVTALELGLIPCGREEASVPRPARLTAAEAASA